MVSLKDGSVGRKALVELRNKPGYRKIDKKKSDEFNENVAKAAEEIREDFERKEKNSRYSAINY